MKSQSGLENQTVSVSRGFKPRSLSADMQNATASAALAELSSRDLIPLLDSESVAVQARSDVGFEDSVENCWESRGRISCARKAVPKNIGLEAMSCRSPPAAASFPDKSSRISRLSPELRTSSVCLANESGTIWKSGPADLICTPN